jgi:hypothetical protein
LAADGVEKVWRAEGPTDPFVSPQGVEHRIVRVGVGQIRNCRHGLARLAADQGVVQAGAVKQRMDLFPEGAPRSNVISVESESIAFSS